jgi:hypothetical protein
MSLPSIPDKTSSSLSSLSSSSFSKVASEEARIVRQQNIISNFVRARNVDVIFGMLEDGSIKHVDVRDSTDYDRTCLMYQAYRGDLTIVRTLLNLGADPNLVSLERGGQGFKQSALVNAVWRNNVEVVRLLLEYGADRNMRCGTYYGKVEDVAKAQGFEEVLYTLQNYFPPSITKPSLSHLKVISGITNKNTPKNNSMVKRKEASKPYKLIPIHEDPDKVAERERQQRIREAKVKEEEAAMLEEMSREEINKMKAFLHDTTNVRSSLANRVAAYRMKTGDFKTLSNVIISRYGWG